MNDVIDVIDNNSNYKKLLKEFRKHKKRGEFDFEDQGRIEVLKNEGLLKKKVRHSPRGYINQTYYKITEDGLFFLKHSCFLSVREISYIIDFFSIVKNIEKNSNSTLPFEFGNLREYLLKISKVVRKLKRYNTCG